MLLSENHKRFYSNFFKPVRFYLFLSKAFYDTFNQTNKSHQIGGFLILLTHPLIQQGHNTIGFFLVRTYDKNVYHQI